MLESLANSGALDEIYDNRKQIFESSESLMRYLNQLEHHNSLNQISLFENSLETNSQLPLLKEVSDWNHEDKLKAEFEACGFYLTTHPIESYLHKLKKLKIINAIELEAKVTQKNSKMYIAGAIVSKKIRSSKRGKYAFIQLSDMTGIIDISVFNEELLLKKNNLLNEGTVIVLKVDARLDENGLRVIAEDILDIQTAVSHIESFFEITINDHGVLESLKQNISSSGKKFNLTITLPTGEEILFSCKKNSKLLIDEDKIHELSKSGKIYVNESCI
jgi:DNA polymerase-3 subunit alpha